MDGFKDRLIITLRFIYDINFIYLLSLLIIFLVFLPLVLGYDGKYDLIYTSFEIIGFDRDNEISFIIQFLIIPIYNFLDWLITGKYHILPKSVTKLIKGRKFLILKTFTALLILLYLASLLTGMYVTNQEEKVAEEARIAKEIQRQKKEKAAEEARIAKEIKRKREAEEARIAKEIKRKREAEEARIAKEIQRKKEEEKKKEEQERIEGERIYTTTYPYQGLSCNHIKQYSSETAQEDIVLILKRNNDKTIYEVDLRTTDRVLDGVIYGFTTILNSSIKITEAEIEIYYSSYNKYILSRSSLKLSDGYPKYQCIKVDYEYLYDDVKKHNAAITDKNKL